MEKERRQFSIIGQDQWLINEKINQILNQTSIKAKEKTVIRLKINENPLEVIIEEVKSGYFFGNKMIILNADDWSKLTKNEKKTLAQAVAESNNWIFVLLSTQNLTTIKQLLPKNTPVEKVEKVTTFKKKQLIQKMFKNNDVCPKVGVVEYLGENLSSNLMIVAQEVNKIINYLQVHPQVLDQQLAEKLTNQQGSGTIFPLIEGLLENNKTKIITSYQKLSRENKINPLVFLATLQTYLFLLKKTQILVARKANFSAITAKIKKSNFFVMNLIKIAKKTNDEKLGHLSKKMYNLERSLKTSRLNETTLIELFLIN